jgi:hypothetical protein
MGQFIGKLLSSISWGTKVYGILMVGLDNAGQNHPSFFLNSVTVQNLLLTSQEGLGSFLFGNIVSKNIRLDSVCNCVFYKKIKNWCWKCREDNNFVQNEHGRAGDNSPHYRDQHRVNQVSERELHGVGHGRPGQDSTTLAHLL